MIQGRPGIVIPLALLGILPACLMAGQGVDAITRPSEDITLSFVRPGRVEKVLVREGDTVKPGQLLVLLDSAEERAVMEQLEAQAKDETRIKAAEAQLAQKKVDLARIRLAKKKGVATDLEVQHAELDVTISELSLVLARFQREQDRRKYEEAQIRVDRMKLSAPAADKDATGAVYKVEKLFVERGESVDRLADVIRIVKIDPLWIDVPVPVSQARALKVAQAARVRFPETRDKPRKGTIIHIAAVADAASATLTVRAEVPNPAGRPAGEQVTVSFDENATGPTPVPPADKTKE